MKTAKLIIVLTVVFFSACTLLIEPPIRSLNGEFVISKTTKVIKNNYPFLSFKKINMDSLGPLYRAKASRYPGDALFELLYEYLSELKDGHVWFYAGGGFMIKPYTPPRALKDRFSYNPETVRSYFAQAPKLTADDKIEFGLLADSIGYIYLSTFARDDGKWIRTMQPIMQKMKNTKGIILDVRHNGGGSDYITAQVIGYFIHQPFPGPIWVDAEGVELPAYTIPPNGTIYYDKPVMVLQNGVCFSAAEGFINTMRELPQVTTIGDTTAGGSGAPKDFYIADHIIIHLPTKAQLTYTGQYIDWNGLPPDILVPQSEKDVERGRDFQLERAIELLGANKR
ncbi:MAG TPA: hypothetical protein ENK44_14890 [Caldithrix abyssi]|uniref:Tail specific protease domain-containing protein n=1 Tax=Caldithrix abyssi TaxID=187145 RepID=A0A7V4UFC2_CALAY|nr:hypothetical protein [Caldithrix abyssi]